MPTLTIICGALVVLMYVPTISKGPLNIRNGTEFYEAFPWDGKVEAATPTPSGEPTPGDAGAGKVMTMQEMMEAARKQAEAGAATPEPTPDPNRVMTMQEMMEMAKKKAAEEQNATPAPTETPAPAP